MKAKIAILNFLDGVSNEKKAKKTQEILNSYGYDAQIIDGLTINIYFSVFYARSWKQVRSILPLYITYIFKGILFFCHLTQDKPTIERANLLSAVIFYHNQLNLFNIIICQIADTSPILTYPLNGLKIYDMPTPWVEELKYSKKYSELYLKKLILWEKNILDSADHVTYGWYSYVNYSKKHLYKQKKYFTCNWGCDPVTTVAQYKCPPKIVFLGDLSGYWVNLRLLSYLTKICPYQIDVYGKPAPHKKFGLRYKGYIKNLDILKEYQFGLVSVTKDNLRKSGWSCKQMDYIGYGLPILMPSWRTDPVFKNVSIYYTKNDFVHNINKYIDENLWLTLQKKSIQLSYKYKWEKTMIPLVEIIRKYLLE